jgi:hypothetical protein
VNVVLRELAQLPAGQTVLVFPEGVMLNYLSRRDNPTPYISFMPPEVLMFGQEAILAAMKDHPPDYVVLNSYSNPREYGFQTTADYAGEIVRWIDANYTDVPMAAGAGFPLKLMKRRP